MSQDTLAEGKTLTRCEELNSMGATLFAQGQLEPARLHFLAALGLEPENSVVLQNLGAVLRNLGHYRASEAVAKRSVLASNGNPYCRSNLGVAQLSLKKYYTAVQTLADVLEDLPNSAPSWHNYGLALYMANRHEEALAAFDEALDLGAVGPNLASDRALCLLALGLIQEGLAAYEVRWDILGKSPVWSYGISEWQGEAPRGLRILVHHEQGFGDTIMLSRFLHILHNRGAEITFAVPNELLRLMEDSFGYLVQVASLFDETLGVAGRFDYHTPTLSLMRHLGVAKTGDIPNEAYLVPDLRDPVIARLPKRGKKIGICWASGNHGPALTDRRRLAPLLGFLPLAEIPDVALISLQKGEEAKDIQAHGLEGLVHDFSHWLTDFAATAAVIAELDMVISVDSAVAHLAGALGVPCIMLSPFTRCWRWWDANTAAPWYNNMTVFSQSFNGTWDAAVEEAINSVTRALEID
jgi:tetratricopeptide (TPR) repeat protein